MKSRLSLEFSRYEQRNDVRMEQWVGRNAFSSLGHLKGQKPATLLPFQVVLVIIISWQLKDIHHKLQ